MTGKYVFKNGGDKNKTEIEHISYTNTRTPTPTFIMNLCYNCLSPALIEKTMMDARLLICHFTMNGTRRRIRGQTYRVVHPGTTRRRKLEY